MNGTAVRPAQAPYAIALRNFKPTWQISLLLLATALVYAGTVKSLVVDWWRNPDYSHGLLLPFALAYVLLQKKGKLRSMASRPTWIGMLLIVCSQIINLVGFLGAEFFLQRFSLLLFLAG